jgi:acyl carrier protein
VTTAYASMQVRAVLSEIVGSAVVDRISDDDRIFERRIVDSLHLVELIERLEERFGTEIDGADLTPENFESVAAMSRFFEGRVAA